jgi:predicted dehydrogenase
MSSAAAVSTAAVSTLISRSAHAAATDTLRIGMVGCGGRCSGAALDALEADPGTRLVAMCDLFPDRIQDKLNSLKTQKPNQVEVDKDHCFTGLDGHKKVIDSVDVVLIACAAKFHPMYVKAAIDAGKHVFTEKPHGIDPPGIRMIADACNLAKQKNLSVVSGLHRRFDPAMQETIKRIHDGAIGDIVAIEENFIRGPYGTLFRAPGLSEIQYQYSNQYRFGWLCGDDVTQSLVHNLDSALWAMKEQNPVKAHGFAGRSSCFDKPFIYGDVFDHHSVVYQFANGVRMYANCRTQPNCFNEVSGIIMGTKGVAYTESYIIQGENKWKYSGQAQNPYRVEHVELFKSIRAAKPINCGDYMCRSTLTAIMGQLACYTGQQLTWDQVSKSDYHIGPRPDQCTWDMQPPVKPDAEGIYPIPIPGKTQLA